MIDLKFSGVLHPSDDVLKYFQESIDRSYYESMKALRLFFLMKFKMPFRCAAGDKTIVHYGNKKSINTTETALQSKITRRSIILVLH